MNGKNIIKIITILMILLLINFGFNTRKIFAENDEFRFENSEMKISIGELEYLRLIGETREVKWESYNPEIATIREGKITGISEGTTTIVATKGNQKAMCEVIVSYKKLIITDKNNDTIFDKLDLTLGISEEKQLRAEAEDYYGKNIKQPKVTWRSFEPEIAEITQDGLLKAKKPGKTTIEIKSLGVKNSIQVEIHDRVEFLDMSDTKIEIVKDRKYGQTLKMTPKAKINKYSNYYVCITNDKVPPKIQTTDYELIRTGTTIKEANINTEENYIFISNMERFIEKREDMYLWVIEEKDLDYRYVNEKDEETSYANKIILAGEKIERKQVEAKIREINISSYYDKRKKKTEYMEIIDLDVPLYDNSRTAVLKIGKIEDKEILKQIEEGKYPERE